MSNHIDTMASLGAAHFGKPAVSRIRFAVPGWAPALLAVVASAMLLAGLKLPLWQMHMEAPQYRDEEALEVAVFPDHMTGDLAELAVLNQYIGVHVPEALPQFKWLPHALLSGAVLGLFAGFLPGAARRFSLVIVVCGLTAALGAAMIQAKSQMHDIGHNRDEKTVLTGVRDFTPPLLGTTKVAQFDVTSRLGAGAWLTGGALGLMVGGAWLSGRKGPTT